MSDRESRVNRIMAKYESGYISWAETQEQILLSDEAAEDE